MGMVVRSNIMAQNANRQLGVNNSTLSKSLEKLASGFKINRAGDDASGLAISEKMKAQIKGLDTASANAQDGISLIQTAEGNLNEVHDMLNRMVELAGKSANGTMKNDVDREALQKEVNDLRSEITRISQSANFNGINLLDGSLGGWKATAATAVAGQNSEMTVAGGALNGADSIALGVAVDGKVTLGSVTLGGVAMADATALAAKGLKAEVVASKDKDGVAKDIGAYSIKITVDDKTKVTKDIADAVGSGLEISMSSLGKPSSAATVTFTAAGTAGSRATGGGLNLQVGDTADNFNKVSVNVANMSSEGLGISELSVANENEAGSALSVIKNAINTVSSNRANLGALQNRLDHTINNLDVASENLNAANSRIRDTDMAKEMMNYTKMNVLTQAAQAMLAQANQQPQSILQLLQ